MTNSKKKSKRSDQGFTLMEILVYVSIVVIVAGAITGFGVWAMRVGAKLKAGNDVMDNARRAMEVMTYEIKKSAGVYAPTSVFGAGPGQLSLEQSTTSLPGEESTFVDFFRCGQALCLKREGVAPVVLTNEKVVLTDLVFNQMLNSPDNPSIQIYLRLQTASADSRPENQDQIELTTAANLRAY